MAEQNKQNQANANANTKNEDIEAEDVAQAMVDDSEETNENEQTTNE